MFNNLFEFIYSKLTIPWSESAHAVSRTMPLEFHPTIYEPKWAALCPMVQHRDATGLSKVMIIMLQYSESMNWPTCNATRSKHMWSQWFASPVATFSPLVQSHLKTSWPSWRWCTIDGLTTSHCVHGSHASHRAWNGFSHETKHAFIAKKSRPLS